MATRTEALTAKRLTAQLLSGPPAEDVAAVARHLLAIQAQDGRGARLAIRSRTRGLTAGDVDHALTDDRSLLITWLNRGTLHLVHSEDYPWLHALTTPRLHTANARRLEQEGISPDDAERAVAIVERALADEGPQTREQLREHVGTDGQALVHILLLASLRGLVVRGPMVDDRHAYVLVRDWLDVPPPVDRERALAELARRFLAGHGPADERDLARWSGLGLRDVRAGLNAIASELKQLPNDLLDLANRPPAAELPPPRLLGSFDPVLFGWVSREPLLGSHTGVVTVNGIFRPIALVRGRAVATWTMPKGEVEVAPFGRLSRADRAALDADAHDVKRFLVGGLSSPVRSRL